MKFVGASLLLVSLVVNLQAGKVTWSDSGSPTISGTSGQGCSQNGFDTEDKNDTKTDCNK
jgi:hypothetical protein